MHYSSGNFEAFARPRKPAKSDTTSAWIVGSGLAGLSAAFFLVRDGQVAGDRIHLLEELPLAGGSLDGTKRPDVGFVTRGGREMEQHFECMWDMYRSIPSLEVEGASYLDEYYWLDKDDPNSSSGRLIHNRGDRVPDDGDLTLSGKAQEEVLKLITASEKSIQGATIEGYFTDDFFRSNFWTYWSTMFAFEKWHSLAEMRRYLLRFIHLIDGLADFSGLKFNKYNQYESMVKPIVAYLRDHGVDFRFGVTVNDIDVEVTSDSKVARKLIVTVNGTDQEIPLTENDLVFVTNGSITESSTYGDHHTPAPVTHEPGGSWTLWENLAKQSPEFGRPEVFYQGIPERSWFVSATATIENTAIDPYIERLTNRDLHDHKVNTGGIITAVDSSWLLSFTVHRQPHFKGQKENETIVWIYSLYSDTEGDFVHKKITECTGEEITQELFYHLGVPEALIPQLAQQESINTVPVYMPFITSYFMPRHDGDRPKVIPDGSRNLAFIGNFAESPTRDTVFTTEYSIRTAMEAVYTFLDIERAIPEVWGSAFDIRQLLRASYYLRDRKSLAEQPVTTDLPIPGFLKKEALKKLHGTWPEELLQESGLL